MVFANNRCEGVIDSLLRRDLKKAGEKRRLGWPVVRRHRIFPFRQSCLVSLVPESEPVEEAITSQRNVSGSQRKGGGGGGRAGALEPWSPEIFAVEPGARWFSLPGRSESLITVKPGAPNEMLWSPEAPIFSSWNPRAPHIFGRSPEALNPFRTLMSVFYPIIDKLIDCAIVQLWPSVRSPYVNLHHPVYDRPLLLAKDIKIYFCMVYSPAARSKLRSYVQVHACMYFFSTLPIVRICIKMECLLYWLCSN